jgi:hypothetical protein
MFKFLNALSYDGKRGTVLRLDDLGDRFRVSLLFINPAPLAAQPAVVCDAAKSEEAESELQRLQS